MFRRSSIRLNRDRIAERPIGEKTSFRKDRGAPGRTLVILKVVSRTSGVSFRRIDFDRSIPRLDRGSIAESAVPARRPRWWFDRNDDDEDNVVVVVRAPT